MTNRLTSQQITEALRDRLDAVLRAQQHEPDLFPFTAEEVEQQAMSFQIRMGEGYIYQSLKAYAELLRRIPSGVTAEEE